MRAIIVAIFNALKGLFGGGGGSGNNTSNCGATDTNENDSSAGNCKGGSCGTKKPKKGGINCKKDNFGGNNGGKNVGLQAGGGKGRCFVAGTPVATKFDFPFIECLIPSDVAITYLDREREELDLPQPSIGVVKQLHRLRLHMDKQNGLSVAITLLRDNEWIEDYGASFGGSVYLDLKEMDAVGQADVLEIGPAEPYEIVPGFITGTFHHTSGDVYDLKLASETKPIGVTSSHPFWSVDREDFIPVGELQICETLKALEGETSVESITKREKPEPVYNIEVEGDHVYRVGESGVLVHNTSPYPRGPLGKDCCKKVGQTMKKSPIVVGGRSYKFQWDDCRTTKAEGPIVVVSGDGDRKESEQKKMLNAFFGNVANADPLRNEYDAGHLIGNKLGGPGDFTNLVPQEKRLNENGAWYQMERWVQGCLESHPTIAKGEMIVNVSYNTSRKPPKRDIPTSFKVTVYMKTASGGLFGSETMTFENRNVATQKKPGDQCPGAVV